MTPALISLLVLLLIIVLSAKERVNVGILALILAWGMGLWVGMRAVEMFLSFPWTLFRILVGITFFFGLAKANGTLDKIAHWMLRLA